MPCTAYVFNNETNPLSGQEQSVLAVMYTCIAIAIAQFHLNLLIVLAIGLQRKLRTRNTYFIIMMTSAGYVIYGLGAVVHGLNIASNCFNYGLILPLTGSNCLSILLLSNVGKMMIVDFSLITAVDRSVAVFFPVWYGKRIRFCLVYIKISIVMLHVVFMNLFEYAHILSKDGQHHCMPSAANGKSLWFAKAEQVQVDVMIALTVLIYTVLTVWAEKEMEKARHRADYSAQTRMHMKVELLRTLVLSIFFYAVTFGVANMLITIQMYNYGIEVSVLYTFAYSVSQLGGILNFVAYYWRTKEIHKSFNSIVICLFMVAKCRHEKDRRILPSSASVMT
uniref:G_PROTEIN_RECEP_F1_2 domain-containing protein n=1 Tax=Trichuris muris TaxID=70415 RepID=A0A5S6R1Q1_TRIMR